MLELNTFLKLDRNIILASASPRRKKLLNQIGLEFEIIPADIEENEHRYDNPEHLVRELSYKKSKHIAQEYSEYWVIGSDTTVAIGNEILNKPEDEQHAFEMLKRLSGNTHSVFTGVSIICNDIRKETTFSVETKVSFNELDENEISAYISTGSPMDKAGSYGIQDDLGSIFVKRIDGCYYNVVGFPISEFYERFKSLINE